jgi:3'-phosphoadenosine 5'-phosphosulfate sulfotransferase (PAPS reductase)/FAD synthetase
MDRALAFSAGKDSWACLWLHEHQLADILVFFIDTGKTIPEVWETVAKAKAMCPNFEVVSVDRDKQNAVCGLPSNIVPVDCTTLGQIITGPKPVRVQSYLECCYANITWPMLEFCRMRGVKELIMGQRADEAHKGSQKHGDVAHGVYWNLPIENWSRDGVMAYLAEKMDFPRHFAFEHSSVDCYDCTAFSKQSRDKVEYLKAVHPDLFKAYSERKLQLNAAIQTALGE